MCIKPSLIKKPIVREVLIPQEVSLNGIAAQLPLETQVCVCGQKHLARLGEGYSWFEAIPLEGNEMPLRIPVPPLQGNGDVAPNLSELRQVPETGGKRG